MASLLVVGSTGLVGSSIIQEACKSTSYPVIALSRSANPNQSHGKLTYVKGDALQKETLKSVFVSNPNVVSTVGTLIDKSEDHKGYERMNRDAVVSVADMMVSHSDGNHRRCLVYVSAAHAPPSMILSEKYLGTKREAENILLGDHYRSKLRVVILRPGLIYSYTRRQIVLPFALGLIMGSALLRPLTSYVPQYAQFMLDRPISDTEVSHAVLEILQDENIEGVCDIDRMRLLAKKWAHSHQ